MWIEMKMSPGPEFHSLEGAKHNNPGCSASGGLGIIETKGETRRAKAWQRRTLSIDGAYLKRR
jgi:hypothetical protein